MLFPMASIAFVTYQKDPSLSKDDFLVTGFLEKNGIRWTAIPWNQPGVNWKSFDLVILRSCWDYYLHLDDFLNWLNYLEENQVKVLNAIQTIRWNLDKTYLLELFDKGVRIPESLLLPEGSSIDLNLVLKEKNWKKGVVKPTVSAGAFETWLFDESNADTIQKELEKSNAHRSFLLQEYREEIETKGEISLIFFNKRFSHAVLKRPKRNDFRVQLKFGGGVESYTPASHIVETAQWIINKFQDEDFLYARVDGIEVGNNFHLMELELIEPNLYLAYDEKAAELFAEVIQEAVSK